MRKKGEGPNIFEPAIMVIVIVVLVIILAGVFLLPKSASANFLTDLRDKYTYGTQWKDMEALQKRTNYVLDCAGGGGNVVTDIQYKIDHFPADISQSMRTRYSDLLTEAKLNQQYCGAVSSFESVPNFDGVHETEFKDALRKAKTSIATLQQTRFQAGILAKEKSDIIDGILNDCKAFSGSKKESCDFAKTKHYCVLDGENCRPTVCSKASTDEKYCNLLADKSKLCFSGYESRQTLGSTFSKTPQFFYVFNSCKPCLGMSDCFGYGLNEKACTSDVCGKGGGACSFPKLTQNSPCRPAGVGEICADHNQDYQNCKPEKGCFWTSSGLCVDCSTIKSCEDYASDKLMKPSSYDLTTACEPDICAGISKRDKLGCKLDPTFAGQKCISLKCEAVIYESSCKSYDKCIWDEKIAGYNKCAEKNACEKLAKSSCGKTRGLNCVFVNTEVLRSALDSPLFPYSSIWPMCRDCSQIKSCADYGTIEVATSGLPSYTPKYKVGDFPSCENDVCGIAGATKCKVDVENKPGWGGPTVLVGEGMRGYCVAA